MSDPVRQKVILNAPDGSSASIQVNEAIAEARKSPVVTTNYTVTVKDYLVLVNAASGAVTITVPTAANMKRKTVIIKKIDSSLNIVTIARSGTDLIEGVTSISLPLLNNAVMLISDGNANWYKASVI